MDRQVLILLLCSFFTSVSFGLVWPYVTVNMYKLGGDFFKIVFLEALPAFSYIFSRIWGAISDYYGERKRLMAIGFFLSAIPLFFAGFANTTEILLLSIFLSEFLSSIGLPAFYTALGVRGGRGVYGYQPMTSSLGFTLGAVLLGPIYTYASQFGVYATAASFTLFAALVILALYKEEASKRIETPFLEHIKQSLKFKVRAKHGFKYFLVASFLVWIAVYWNDGLLKVKLYELLGRSVEGYSLVIGFGAGLLSIPASILASRMADKYGGAPVFTLGLLCYSLLIPSLALVHDPSLFTALYILPVWPLFWAGQYSLVHELSEEEFEGENMGTLMTVTSVSAFPALIGGLVADVSGLEHAIFSTTFFYLSSLGLMALVFKRKAFRKLTP